MMMSLGFLFMLLVLAVPVILIVILGIWLFYKGAQKNMFSTFTPAQTPTASPSERVCSHCGTRLQADWSHCPQCGAAAD